MNTNGRNHLFSNCVKYVTVHIYDCSELFMFVCFLFKLCEIRDCTCSISFIAPAVWNSLTASLWNLPNLPEFKTQLKTFLFRQTYVDHAPSHRLCVLYVYVSMCIYYVHEWCVLAHWVFVLQNHLGSERAIHYYFSINYSALCARMHKKKDHIKALHNIKAVSRKSPKNISIVTK